MELTIDQATLSRALRLVARVVPTRPALPILQMVLLEAEAGRLHLSASDAELAMTTTVAAEVGKSGRVAIPARLLSDYVAHLPAEPLRLAFDSARHRVRAVCGPFVATFATAEADEFPTLPDTSGHAAVDLEADRLRDAIARVAFAAARDESRPVLSAVLFDFAAEGLTLVAADGFRLARSHLPEAAAAAQHLLVPARAVAEFGRLLADAEAARLLVAPDGRGVSLVVGGTTMYTRLIEGRFPDIERVIPRDCVTRVRVDATAFRQAVRVSGLFGSGDARPVVLEAAPGRLHLRARGDETGEAESDLPASLDGESQAVALNTRLLVDLLDAVDDGQLEVAWTSPQAPVVVREAARADTADLFVTMPLHDPALVQPRGKEQQPAA